MRSNHVVLKRRGRLVRSEFASLAAEHSRVGAMAIGHEYDVFYFLDAFNQWNSVHKSGLVDNAQNFTNAHADMNGSVHASHAPSLVEKAADWDRDHDRHQHYHSCQYSQCNFP